VKYNCNHSFINTVSVICVYADSLFCGIYFSVLAQGKGKKAKRSKMFRVDNRILGFSVTAAQDRINVGDRDYVDGL
jgi:uncharacterized ferredoxin-like protein